MRVRLNLATKPLVAHRKFLAGSTILGIAAAIVFVWLGRHVYAAQKANAEMRAKTAQVTRQLGDLEQQRESLERFFAIDENKKLHDRSAFLNDLIDARSFNWTLMFMDLEKLLPAGVRVISIEPKQNNGRVLVRFSIGATSDENKLKFIKALESSKSFSDVQLMGVHRPTIGSGAVASDQIVVDLTAEYSRT
jgi:type IV pilus assembly protein PilN